MITSVAFSLLCLLLLPRNVLTQAASSVPVPSDFPGSETPYQVTPTGVDAPVATVNNKVGTFLYLYYKCKENFGPGAKGKIDQAYYDAWILSNTAGVKSDIDWNSAAALEYLGPPGYNKNQQAQIQAVLANTATVIYSLKNPFQHYIKIRCNDPKEKCLRKPDDGCTPGLSNPPADGEPKIIAYSTNDDGDGVPMINFCPAFFNDYRSLDEAVARGQALLRPNAKLRLNQWDNRARIFLHELFHLNLAANSPSPNPRVVDLSVRIKLGRLDQTEPMAAYGDLVTKVMARWPGTTANKPTGYYTQRNADSLALYALAKYVTTKNNNVYPHLPVVTQELSGNPWKEDGILGSLLAEFIMEDGNFFFNTTEDLTQIADQWNTVTTSSSPGCSDNEDAQDADSSTSIGGFIPDSAYPDEYIKRLSEWISDLTSSHSEDSDNGDDGSDDSSSTGAGQQLALATYIDPGANMGVWERIISFPSDKISIVVANVVNGPDSAVNAGWKDVIPRAAASGKTVLGYVRTGYLGVSFQKFTTRLGSSLTSDWVAQIQEDVDQWYALYPGSIGGIFFDEGWNDCGENNVNAELYKFITQSTKKKYPGAFTVLNPGAPMPQCFEHSADTLLTAEISYATYTGKGYVGNDWTPSDSRKIWHIVYDVPISQAVTVAVLAKERGVGLLHITDDVEPNPYDTVPDDGYMYTIMGAISGGKPLNEGVIPLKAPGVAIETLSPFMTCTFTDYSSATFHWSVALYAIGYRLYQDNKLILELTPSMTTVTVGGLEPGSRYAFHLTSINPDDTDGNYLDSISLQTLSLPKGGHTVSSTDVTTSGGSSVYTARILVPYAFIRLFMYDNHCVLAGAENEEHGHYGWPINYAHYDTVCNQYMVEGGTLYKYSGKMDSEGNMPWSWTWTAEVQVVQDGYDWKWTVPLNDPNMDPNKYLVQVAGYGPKFNVYHGCSGGVPLTSYDGMMDGNYCV